MTITEPSTNGHRAGLPDEEARAAARADYRADRTLTGRELGERYQYADGTSRSEEWGRKQQRAVRDEDAGPVPGEGAAGTGNGTPSAAPATRSVTPRPRVATVPARRRGTPQPEPAADLIDRWGRPIVGWFITGLALLLSYSHMRHLAELAGVSWPALAPLLVDGLMAAAVLCLRRHGRYWAAWLALVLAAGAAMVLNGLAERSELVDLADVRLWWALLVPAVAAFSLHLVLKR